MNKGGPAKSSSTLPKKESILELSKLQDQLVRVKCIGGRELLGILRGYDELVNLVLDECDEFLRGKRKEIVMWQSLCTSNDRAVVPWCDLTSVLNDSHISFATDESQQVTDKKRRLGLVVIRGTQVSVVAPNDGVEEIANPFVTATDDDE
jgi:U6 snRNA-associated Sm-like protein LSm7